MDNEKVVAELESAQNALTIALNYPRVLQVEEYADLSMALSVVYNIRVRLEKNAVNYPH